MPTTPSVEAPHERPPLRVGLLLDSFTLPTWEFDVVRDIAASGIARVALVVLNVAPPPAGAEPVRGLRGRVGRWITNRHHLPFALYDRLDRWHFGRRVADPFAPCDARALLAGVPVVEAAPRQTKFSDFLDDETCAQIAAHDLDVAVRFGFRILRGRALTVARYGVWSYHHGDNAVNRGGPAGYWEVFEGLPATGAVLQVLSEDLDGGRAIARMFASTDQISPTKNRANYFWQAAGLIHRKLRDVHELGEEGLAETTGPPNDGVWSPYSNRLYVAPRPGEMWHAARAILGRYVRAKSRSLRYDPQWFLAYKLARPAPAAGAGADADVPDGTFFRFRTLMPPRGVGWADPFPVHVDGRHYMFFEEFGLRGGDGRICVVEIGADGTAGAPAPVLERDYHLSYPFVFRHEGAWYMIPETEVRNAVELYRATRFPHEWEFDRTLLEVESPSDATIAEINGRWWMFVATRAPNVTEWTQLAIFHAPSPLGPWLPHARNPVRIDARNTRPAGRIFRHKDAYYRPAQDGTPIYGSAIVVHRIDALDLTTFRETPVARIEPHWQPGLTGTHTINAAGGLTAIDVRHWRPR